MFVLIIIAECRESKTYEESISVITVRENETLWDIAEDYKNDNQDIREYISILKKLNNMQDSIIYEGQEIRIIEYLEKN